MGNGYKKNLTTQERSILTWDAFQSYMKSILDKETKISDWQEGYIGVPSKLPYNAITQKEYSGINAISLFFNLLEQGYSLNGWVPDGELKKKENNYTLAKTGAPADTLPPDSDLRVKITYPSFFVLDVKAEDKDKKVYKDIVKKLKKAKVVGKSYKNKKGVIVRTSYGVSIKTLNELGLTKEERRYFFATNYNETTVVNVSNIKEFVEKAQTVKTATKGGDNEKAEWLISKFSEADNCPVMINAENVSCPAYSPNAHKIFMPKGVYDNKETYYSSCLHEIGHATKKGLGRFNNTLPEEEIQKLSPERKKLYDILSNEKNPKAFYAYEELVAELSSVFMAQLCGMEKIKIVDDLSGTPLENHAAYLSSWLNTYDSEVGKTLLDFALTDVSMAVNYAISQSKFYEKFPESVGLLDVMLNKKMGDKNKTIETYFDTVIYNEKPLKEYVFDADNKVILTVPKEFTRFTVESNKENNFYNTNAADGELLDDVYRIVVTDENGTRTGVGIDKNNTLCLDDKNSLVFENLSDVKDFASQIGITFEAITNNENIKGLEGDKTMGSTKQPTQNLLKEGTDFTISPEGVLEFLPHVKTITPVQDLVSDVGRIKKVIIPEGVTKIGAGAFFGCKNLINVVIPDSVKAIGWRAFEGCYNLTSVIIPDSVKEIGTGAFRDCRNLSDLVLPNGITTIGYGTFRGCERLTSVTIPESVTIIEDGAFTECAVLQEVNLPEGLQKIGAWAFGECENLRNIKIPKGVERIGEWAFSGCNCLEDVTISEGVKIIGAGAFDGCVSLTDLKLPESLTRIELSAFQNCIRLMSVVIPEGVKIIEEQTFNRCNSLKDVTLPKGLTRIGDYAFQKCANLRGIVLPEGVTSIGYRAFSGCESLEEVNLPARVEIIGGEAFERCINLNGIVFPKSVTKIGERAFEHCENLTSVIVSNPETKIGNFAFDHCDKLKEIKFFDGITGSEQYNNSPSKESLFDTIEVSEQTSWVHRNGAAPFSENYPYVENKRISEVSKSLDSVMNGDKGNFSVGITPDFKKGYIVLRTYKGTETERNLDKALGENAVCFEPKTNDFTQYKCYLIKVSPEDCQGLKEKASFTSPQIVSKSGLMSVFHDGKTTLPINEISPDFYQKTLQPVNKEFLSEIIDSLADKKEMSYSASKLKTGDPETDALITDSGAYGPEVGAAITFNNAVEKNGLSRTQTIGILNQETCYTGMITESVSSNILTPQTNQQSNQNY